MIEEIDKAGIETNRDLVRAALASWEEIDRGLVLLFAGLGVTLNPVVVDDRLTVRVDCPTRKNASSCISFIVDGKNFSVGCAPAWALLKAAVPFKEAVASFNQQIADSKSGAETALATLQSLQGEIGVPKSPPKKRVPKAPAEWPKSANKNTRIEKLGFSPRVKKLLQNKLSILTVGDLLTHTRESLKVKRFGPSAIAEVDGFLGRYHRRLSKAEKPVEPKKEGEKQGAESSEQIRSPVPE